MGIRANIQTMLLIHYFNITLAIDEYSVRNVYIPPLTPGNMSNAVIKTNIEQWAMCGAKVTLH